MFLIIKAQWSFLVFDPSPEPSHRRTAYSRAGRAHNTQTLLSILSMIKVISNVWSKYSFSRGASAFIFNRMISSMYKFCAKFESSCKGQRRVEAPLTDNCHWVLVSAGCGHVGVFEARTGNLEQFAQHFYLAAVSDCSLAWRSRQPRVLPLPPLATRVASDSLDFTITSRGGTLSR